MLANGLSTREANLLATWERERRTRVTMDELRVMIGPNALLVAKRMAKKGALQRISRGIYVVRPLRLMLHRASPSAPVLVAHLLRDCPYYLGGLWGLTLHHLTEQQYASVVDAFVVKRRRRRKLSHARVNFHVLRSAAFDYGITTFSIEGISVRVSDAERTVLDFLDYPDLAGGLEGALELIRDAIPRLDLKTLVAHAVRGSHMSTSQRLGLLLERSGAAAKTWAPLHRHVQRTSSLLSMIPGQARQGGLNVRWNVIENDLIENDLTEER